LPRLPRGSSDSVSCERKSAIRLSLCNNVPGMCAA
jgi:hypothetical protein